jgi:hypothetical protein
MPSGVHSDCPESQGGLYAPLHPQASPSPALREGFILELDSTSLKGILKSEGVIHDGKAVFAGEGVCRDARR